MDVQQHQVGLLAVDLAGRLSGGAGAAEHLVIGVAQQHVERCSDHWMVIDEQDSGHAAAPNGMLK